MCVSIRVFHITPFFELSYTLLTTHALGLYKFTKKNFSVIDQKLKCGERFSFLHFLPKVPIFGPKKWHFEWPNQNSKTTFIVQTFPKYGHYDFYLVNLSLLGAILAIFQFCGFSGLFWPFFPCNCNV